MNGHTGFFVTGTDTEVGKTLVSGALILKLRAHHQRVLGFKPVVAGTYQDAGGQTLNEDLETLRIASHPSTEVNCPYILNDPAAPHLVARSAGISLDMGIMIDAFTEAKKQCDAVVVEGAGGLLIPINDHEDLSHFAQQINLPVILVVGMKLGCINHALLTLEALKARRLNVLGWVANALAQEMHLLPENIETLRSRIPIPFLGLIPPLPPELQKQNNSPYSMGALQFAAEHIQLP
ncbi:dethiobiotin synthase [Polynucleobacter sp. UK-Kesae-W10]|uniref:dethiobiotin synthase n=1 Tax=Polynucleobacter sp. UK-Kesae-W10 TaxID=1819738 RepID=UPI001C0D1CE6|nr:dethiobiotin synthase [Polynucleobacter sp. UK-Kesae-W10]MBU3576773.1 dethiobiotin synthase [Polynucleobacter sp. UK-Kesae-W10]